MRAAKEKMLGITLGEKVFFNDVVLDVAPVRLGSGVVEEYLWRQTGPVYRGHERSFHH